MTKIKLFLGQFYQRELGEAEMLLCREYVDLLDVFTNEEINKGITHYQINGPRNNGERLTKPAAGDLYQFLMKIRCKANVEPKKIVEPKPIKRVTQEQRLKIAKELNFPLQNVLKPSIKSAAGK